MIRFRAVLFISLATLLSSIVHADPALDAQAESQGVPITELRVFAEVMERIRATYIEDIDDRTLLESAIRGMLYELDPHSSYLTPSEFDDLQISTSGEFGGLGIEVTMENGFVKVVTPLDDTPASRAGLRSGDLILKIDDTFVKGMALEEAINLLRGEIGSSVDLSILSEGTEKPRSVSLTRDRIRIQSVRAQEVEPGFGYLRITQFQSHSGRDAEKALRKLMQDSTLKGVVLDLRNNPGGVLNAAVQISDLFLDEGLIVYTQGRDESSRINYAATKGDLINGLPLVVLVNGGSASASEIVAGALQDHSRAIVMGQRSFGKGSVQTILPLHGDRALKLTTARYYTPNGRSIQAEGIVPDILSEVSKVELITGRQGVREADLRGHLENGKSNGEEAEQSSQPLAATDFTLYEALSVLKGIALAMPHQGE
ncbi:S41 family peptidase [Alcanivorax sp. 1008]|uniref:S41 family peptidase n=1 Tax=Alcanivorax sp. 1008 TaxID=2816853 RepID=UPI001E15EDAA|nr:S41 family peptidase [Alcanivorax sp. 1008]MCC1495802.1 S41 family peptidase [Alcanivorax sp. 1008]